MKFTVEYDIMSLDIILARMGINDHDCFSSHGIMSLDIILARMGINDHDCFSNHDIMSQESRRELAHSWRMEGYIARKENANEAHSD